MQEEQTEYIPDLYWEQAGVSYPYYPSVRHRKRFIINAIKKYRLKDNSLIFDYGCGVGAILKEVKKVFRFGCEHFGGCDISARAIDIAKKELDTPYLYNDLFPVLNRRCDIIICCEVLEHTKDYFRILLWIRDNLADGGRLILTTQTGRIHRSDRYTGHAQHFEIAHLKAILRNMGFNIEYASLWGWPFFTLQKYLTNFNFGKIRNNYLEGRLTLRKKIVFGIANILFYIHDLIKLGPQIYIIASKERSEQK